MTVEQQLDEVTGQATGELRIVAPMSFGQRRLAPVVARFALTHPKLRVTLRLEDRETDIVSEGLDPHRYPHLVSARVARGEGRDTGL
jgi:DNA-binding transcriptional LysR family regulator